MKKIIMLLLTLTMIVSVPTTAHAADGNISITSAEAKHGQTVYLTVSLADCKKANTLGISMEYDSTVLKKIVGECTWAKTGILQDFDVAKDSGVWASSRALDLNGEVCTLAFRVKANAPVGDTKVGVTLTVKNDSKTIGTYTTTATVTVTCEHLYSEWTSINDDIHMKVCENCGLEKTSSHDWQDGVCLVCGAEKGNTEDNSGEPDSTDQNNDNSESSDKDDSEQGDSSQEDTNTETKPGNSNNGSSSSGNSNGGSSNVTKPESNAGSNSSSSSGMGNTNSNSGNLNGNVNLNSGNQNGNINSNSNSQNGNMNSSTSNPNGNTNSNRNEITHNHVSNDAVQDDSHEEGNVMDEHVHTEDEHTHEHNEEHVKENASAERYLWICVLVIVMGILGIVYKKVKGK